MQNKFQGQIIPKERWRWVAHYTDGTKLCQFDDETGEFHQFQEIDQSKLSSFQMVSDDNPQGFNLLIPQGADLIHFYRNTVFNMGTPNEIRLRSYIFGWKILIDGRVFKRLIAIRPDDFITLLDDDGRP
jgi:hypothetical protein